MNVEEFADRMNLAVKDLLKNFGSSEYAEKFILNHNGYHELQSVAEISRAIYCGNGKFPKSIDIGLTNNLSINEVYIVVSGHDFVTYDEVKKNLYGLPINIMGRAL
ncbi:hypothetical protein [Sphingobium lactosutens]|uniref:hypothetical protein n=1 Tax=Sphingobium lactosutens TaxID=522773 RepID=UPI0015BA76CE|nr:hypothetical protein [Sphingobium lactosutens]